MAKTERRSIRGMGAETFFGEPAKEETQEPDTHRETGEPSHSETGQEEKMVKTSFYPTRTQLEKLDDLATDYNKRYRRQRPKINRNDIIRYLIDQCNIDTLEEFTLTLHHD